MILLGEKMKWAQVFWYIYKKKLMTVFWNVCIAQYTFRCYPWHWSEMKLFFFLYMEWVNKTGNFYVWFLRMFQDASYIVHNVSSNFLLSESFFCLCLQLLGNEGSVVPAVLTSNNNNCGSSGPFPYHTLPSLYINHLCNNTGNPFKLIRKWYLQKRRKKWFVIQINVEGKNFLVIIGSPHK